MDSLHESIKSRVTAGKSETKLSGRVSIANLQSNHLLQTHIFEVLPCRTSKATDGKSTSSSTNLYTSTSYTSNITHFSNFINWLSILLINTWLEIIKTSWIWSLESSVKARRSCRRIPASSMNKRAPSFMVPVRSNLLWTCQSVLFLGKR